MGRKVSLHGLCGVAFLIILGGVYLVAVQQPSSPGERRIYQNPTPSALTPEELFELNAPVQLVTSEGERRSRKYEYQLNLTGEDTLAIRFKAYSNLQKGAPTEMLDVLPAVDALMRVSVTETESLHRLSYEISFIDVRAEKEQPGRRLLERLVAALVETRCRYSTYLGELRGSIQCEPVTEQPLLVWALLNHFRLILKNSHSLPFVKRLGEGARWKTKTKEFHTSEVFGSVEAEFELVVADPYELTVTASAKHTLNEARFRFLDEPAAMIWADSLVSGTVALSGSLVYRPTFLLPLSNWKVVSTLQAKGPYVPSPEDATTEARIHSTISITELPR